MRNNYSTVYFFILDLRYTLKYSNLVLYSMGLPTQIEQGC